MTKLSEKIEGLNNLTEITNKGISMDDEVEVNKEKLKGNFVIHINV